jgi:glutaredoxin
MAYMTFRFALVGSVAAALVATSAAGQNQQVYRYVDKEGRVVYSDRGPPSDAKDVQAKRMRGNLIEDSVTPIAAQQAQERFPVTLYSFTCGEVCTQAEGLLNRRGVPFTAVNVETPEGAEQLNKMTGELRAPVLQVGDRTFVKGYSEAQWNTALDDAGYPKAQPPRRTAPSRAPTADSTTAAAAAAASASTSEPRAVNAPATYPRQ